MLVHMSMISAAAMVAAVPVDVRMPHNDPAGSWLSYAVYSDPQDRRITMLNTSWIVPGKPSRLIGSNAPGWWFGTQTAKGDGALIQPILAWGYMGPVYTIFNGVFDWTDQSWHTSTDKITVQPGDRITSSLFYVPTDNAYTMTIRSETSRTITMTYKLLPNQKGNESTAYFVLEHQPDSCEAYPINGRCTFEDIYLEVDNQPVTPEWKAMQERPACDSKAVVVDSKTIKFSWIPTGPPANPAELVGVPPKWGQGQ